MSLENLYQEIILDHYKHPRNFGELPGCSCSSEHENPLCGDQLRVSLDVREGQLAEVRFAGKGCAISQASASMMTEAVRGRSVEDARERVGAFLAMMRGEREFEAPEGAEELDALRGVLQFPVRIKCATLAWNALAACLAGAGVVQDAREEQ